MKIKHGLMLTYLVVMILPVAALFALYTLISAYDERQNLKEMLAMSDQMSEIEASLTSPSLYRIQPIEHYDGVRQLTNKSIQITLYRNDGVRLFSSMDEGSLRVLQQTSQDKLYRNLNEIRRNTRTYSLKRPVVESNELIGFYEITIARQDWTNEVRNRSSWTGLAMLVVLLLVYGSTMYFLHRKLNRPASYLMKRMSDYASGKKRTAPISVPGGEIGELILRFEEMKDTIERSKEEIEKQHREKSYMIAALSHDLKTPLTSIKAYTEALTSAAEQLTIQEREEYQSIIFDKISYMEQLIKDLAMYTALQSSESRTELVEVDGEEFFEMLLSGYEELCGDKQILFHAEIQVGGTYRVHPGQMSRLVDNLVGNAIRHTPTGKHVWLSAYSAGTGFPDWVFEPFRTAVGDFANKGAVLLVQNEGEAIPPEELHRIFEPFYQVDGARVRNKDGHVSSGLGLSIAKMIMDRHQGEIAVWSDPGYGTLFACRIPRDEKG